MANDLTTVLKAIAHVETNDGKNSYPRFERSFAPAGFVCTVQGHVITGTGTNFTAIAKARWEIFGMASACSFSSWQILFHTAADRGYRWSPWELWNDAEARKWVEKEVLRQFNKGANTIQKLADAWNSGSFADANVPIDYVAHVVAAFVVAGGDPAKPLEIV